tara:strand:- start:66 stop:989 length:924 start_codon:yes stop_codon:yes gene_type:complete
MERETAGDPVSGLKWTRKTTRKIANELKKFGHDICSNTVGRLLKKLNFSLKVNHKKNETNPNLDPKERDEQFKQIFELRDEFEKKGFPVISIDAKKKELIGNFKNNGQAYAREPEFVNVYDFLTNAIGKGVPYGIYDTIANKGFVCVGTNYDTPLFAVDSVETWWNDIGKNEYPDASDILILADGGGSNSSRSRVWKHELQKNVSSKHGIKVTVCHYPPGCSKWNPIEHRLFSAISKNWSGVPLRTYQTMLNYIKTTTTTKGLTVNAKIVLKKYEKGVKISDDKMKSLPILYNNKFPKWNYTLLPSK